VADENEKIDGAPKTFSGKFIGIVIEVIVEIAAQKNGGGHYGCEHDLPVGFFFAGFDGSISEK